MNKFSALLFSLALLTVGCASAPPPKAALDCESPETQKMLTFCASPAAAELALENAALSKKVAEGTSPDSLGPVPVAGSPMLGNPDAPVTVVIFTDLQCPYCAKAHESVKEVVEKAGDDVRVVFKHMPLPFHPHAVVSGVAAVAAGNQGKFWEHVEVAYAHQDALDAEQHLVYAQELGLDVVLFKADMQSQASIDVLRADVELAQAVGVRGTPTFFVNGKRLVGAVPVDEFLAEIAAQKELYESMLAVGVDAKSAYWRLASVNFVAPEPMPEPEPEAEPEVEVAFVPFGTAPSTGAATDAALVTIVEFSDFECPFCKRGAANIGGVVAKNSKTVRLAYRHFPLEFHENAIPAALLSMLAAEKGKFWEFHDAVFAEESFTVELLIELAKKTIGVDDKTAKAALENKAYQEALKKDMELAKSVGVQGTPNFFINGIKVSGAQPPELFEALIEEQAKLAALVSEETGLKGKELYEQMVKLNQAQ